MTRSSLGPELAAKVVAHHLRLFGAPGHTPRVDVLLGPSAADLAALGVGVIAVADGPQTVRFPGAAHDSWHTVRSLHAVATYHCSGRHEVVAVDASDRPCWLTIRHGAQITLVVGTDLAGDLVRYRQGDPARVEHRQTTAMWGIAGERPIYLFDAQQPPGSEHDRQADWWAMALAVTVSKAAGKPLLPMLPNGAPGAIVVTGDDDQAYLEKYDEQIDLLNGLPVTYFLHPLTRHTPQTIAAIRTRTRVELGLHPDAIEHPDRYAELFRTQAAWFHQLTGMNADLVRNHGFLNDGYWGHLPVWLAHGVRVSSNLPGVNGTVLNGSLLPARMAWDGALTPHWSILTAVGDGVRYALGADGPESARCITDLATRIETSRLPGVIVVNLHPQNVADTREMHAALHQLRERGFVAMTLGECIDWFAARDMLAP